MCSFTDRDKTGNVSSEIQRKKRFSSNHVNVDQNPVRI